MSPFQQRNSVGYFLGVGLLAEYLLRKLHGVVAREKYIINT